jgi:AraC-like DNA-binding protein
VTTPSHLRGSESDVLVVSVKLSGTATLTQAPGRLLRGGDLFVTDLWRPFEFFDQGGENTAFYIPLDRLGLPRDYAAQAGQLLHVSPMAAQIQRHFRVLFRDADAISQSPAASMIGQATTDLVRAALVSAVDEEPFRSGDWGENLITVAKSYISQHLADPDLGAEAIARAMFISVRQVYKLWETEPRSLGQWVLERRLDAARRELTSPRRRNLTIAAIAGRWGFVDATHFSRRFRQAYGMSPREWRQVCASAAIPTG